MTIYRILVMDDDNDGDDAELMLFTSEALFDIKHAIEKNLAVFDTREEYDEANADEEND